MARLFGSENCVFKVVIVYENPMAAARAEEMRDRLAMRFQHSIHIESEAWDYELLNCPDIRERAATAAVAADMVIVSANGGIELPEQVKLWLERWLARKSSSQASLVALVDEDHEIFGEPPLVGIYLREIARRAGMDFFCNVGDRLAAREPQQFIIGEILPEPFHLARAGFA